MQRELDRRVRDTDEIRTRLLKESESRETALNGRIGELQSQLKAVKKADRIDADRFADAETMATELERVKSNERRLATELRQVRGNETRLAQLNRELDADANVLSEKLSRFRALEAECESLRDLNASLQTEAETLEEQVQSTAIERQLVEQRAAQMFDTLTEERKARREIEEQLVAAVTARESLPVASSVHDDDNPQLGRDETDAAISASCLSDELLHSVDVDPSRVMRLEDEVQSLREERSRLVDELESTRRRRCVDATPEIVSKQLKTERELAEVRHALAKLEASSTEEIEHLKTKVGAYEGKDEQHRTTISNLEAQLASLGVRLKGLDGGVHDVERVAANRMASLERDLNEARALVGEQATRLDELATECKRETTARNDVEANLERARHDVDVVCGELKKLYRYVCLMNGDVADDDDDDDDDETTTELESSSLSVGTMCLQTIARVKQRGVALKRAVERTVELSLERSRRSLKRSSSSFSTSAAASAVAEAAHKEDLVEDDDKVEALQEKVGRLQRQLCVKEEEVVTMKVLMKALRTSAETAVENARSRFESDRKILEEIIEQLRLELKDARKRESEYGHMRSVFANRCDEYVSQLTELQLRLEESENERRTLESMLSATIKQKISLRQRLEDFEIEKERMYNIPRQLPSSTI